MTNTLNASAAKLAHANAAKLAGLLAERDKLEAAATDFFMCRTAGEVHDAEEALAAWDRAHDAEIDALIEIVDAGNRTAPTPAGHMAASILLAAGLTYDGTDEHGTIHMSFGGEQS